MADFLGDLSSYIATKANNAVTSVTSRFSKVPGVPAGAEPEELQSGLVRINGDTDKDLRVKIRVPSNYLNKNVLRPVSFNGGIIFPYTPEITYETVANYSPQTPTHSNFALNFYQRSGITNITISGQFTVQHEDDAAMYLATVHLLRALTKMRQGKDNDAGSPPPVCRLDAYGDMMLANVPVSISSVTITLPNNVDYYTLGKDHNSYYLPIYGQASVPTNANIKVVCVPIYSRAEMQNFTVTGWLTDKKLRSSGIL